MNNTRLDAFKTAGELYGRIHEQLGFGALSMSFEGQHIEFIWIFTARKQPRFSQWKLHLLELHFDESHRLEHLADYIVARWKNDHKLPEGQKL